MTPSSRRPPSLLLLFLSVLLLLLCRDGSCASVSEKTINVAMSATWPSPPLLVETSEYLASVDPAYYWKFLSMLAAHTGNSSFSSSTSPPTDVELYALVRSLASTMLGHAGIEVMSSTLALHTHAVKAQLYYTLLRDTQLSRPEDDVSDCAAVVQYAGRLSCALSGVDVSGASDETVYDFDHVYPGGGAPNRTIILWADITALHATDAHARLSQMVSRRAAIPGMSQNPDCAALTPRSVAPLCCRRRSRR